MGKDDVLLVAGNYPHALMQYMNILVKEKGRSILWDGSFVQLFDNVFPGCGQAGNVVEKGLH